MTEYTPEKVAELVADLRARARAAVTHEATDALNAAADALTAVSAERDAEHRRAEGFRQAFLNTSKDRFRIKDERDRLHEAITEALEHDPLHGKSCILGILRAALDKEGNDDE